MKFGTTKRVSRNQSSFTQRRKGAKPPSTSTFLPLRLCLLAPLREKFGEETRSSAPGLQRANNGLRWALPFVLAGLMISAIATTTSAAQNPPPSTDTLKKANARPAETPTPKSEPFDGTSIEKMTGQCVTLDTEQGLIVIEMLPAKAPETVRSFLNLAATGALDTTTFSRVVKGFVIQGGNLSTSDNWSAELSARMSRRLPDEPSDLKHVRGIVSMARADEPNSATTHFFILVGNGPHLDGKFAGFGRVIRGIEVADAINRAPEENERPLVAARIKHAGVAQCQK